MSYTVREVSALLGIPAARIRSLASRGFLSSERGGRGELRFGFHDLVILRTASALTAANIPPRKVRRALEKLRDQLPEGHSIAGVRIIADGERVIVRDGEAAWNPESGQAVFDFDVADLAEKTRPFVARAVEEARERESAVDADEWYDLGCELEISSPDKAQEAYERALDADPSHTDANVNLGRLLHEQNAPAAAEKHYRAALETDPHHPIAAYNLGVALEDLGRIDEAIDAYEHALELDPSNPDAHFNLAGLCERRGDKAGAVRHLKAYANMKDRR